MTVSELFRLASERLCVLYPEEEIRSITRQLLQHHTGLSTAQIYADPGLSVVPYYSPSAHEPASPGSRFIMHALDQLADGRPLQYVLGETEFCGHLFEVNENVLIPRPETEELVLWALDSLQGMAAPQVLDLCTGSGCIAVSVSAALPAARVAACDISAGALEVARRNALRNEAVVDFFECDILKEPFAMPAFGSQPGVDCMLSNPPYVRNSEKAFMHRNVLDYEPAQALFVEDADPLLFYRAIARIARTNLLPDGFVLLEINEALADETAQAFKKEGFGTIQCRKDMFGKDRMLKIKM